VFRIADFEHSRRTPTPDQYRKLHDVLALDDVPSERSAIDRHNPHHPVGLSCLDPRLPLATLADALGMTLGEVHDGVVQVRDRLRAAGLEIFVDQTRAHVVPVSWCARPVRVAAAVSELNAADVEVLAILHEQDGARVKELEGLLGTGVRLTLTSLHSEVWSAALRRARWQSSDIGSRTTASCRRPTGRCGERNAAARLRTRECVSAEPRLDLDIYVSSIPLRSALSPSHQVLMQEAR